jgi:inosine/xanthosine triphosphatase
LRKDAVEIAVGSRNPAKLEAVQSAVLRVWPDAAVRGVSVSSGVSVMPMSDGECLVGARQRALAARAAGDADLGIGLEGGVSDEPAGLMLVGWVVVVDGAGKEGVAATARLPLPSLIASRVRQGEELGPVMDDLLNETKSNHRGGAVGALTSGLVLRADAFAMAVAYALAPFVTADFYPSTAVDPSS